MAHIIILDELAAEGLQLLDQAAGIRYNVHTGLSGPALREALRACDGAICRSGVKLDAAALEGNRRLRVIVRAGVGTDNIDKAAATRQGIVVMNTPAGNTTSTAEHAFALLLGLARNLAAADHSLRQGNWNRSAFTGTQLAGKTLGIVGLGRIGREVAHRALAFDMRVLGFDPFLSADRARELGMEPVTSVKEMLPRVDFLTVHTPLTAETKGLIGPEAIASMRPTARLINCARGGIFDEAALVAAIQSGRLAGVALDVFEHEPCRDHPLFQLPNTLVTPHLGASTDEAQTQVAVEAAELIVAYLTRGEVRHAVNMVAIDPATMASLKGHLDLVYRLGLFLAQWIDGIPSNVRLAYRGEITDKNTHLLTSAFCAGFLSSAMDESLNIVNAGILMKDRGIDYVAESHSQPGAFSSSIRATVETDTALFAVAGTLFGTSMPRLVMLNDYRLEAYLDGTLLTFSHRDVPGIIGAVGTILGDQQVNIAQMAVGRETQDPGGSAIGVLNLDSPPPQSAVDALLACPHILQARVIQMPPAGQFPDWLQL